MKDAPIVWVPLDRAALCNDCWHIFWLRRQGCPVCASHEFLLLINLLDKSDAAKLAAEKEVPHGQG